MTNLPQKLFVIFLSVFLLIFSRTVLSQNDIGKNITFENLQKKAECIAAYNMFAISFQLEGNFSGQKTHAEVAKKLYSQLARDAEYFSNGNKSVYDRILNLPQRETNRYGSMGNIQQLRYAQEVENVNNCFYLSYFDVQK